MRRSSSLFACLLASALSLARPADAGEGKSGSEKSAREASGGAATSGSSGGGAQAAGFVPASSERSGTDGATRDGKAWSASAGWEFHRTFVQNDLEGYGSSKNLNYFSASATYELVPGKDKLALYGGLYRFDLADPNETGWRADDIVLAYTHRFALPHAVALDATASLLAPTSFVSYRMGLITAPRARARVERTFGGFLTVDAAFFGQWYWQRYREMLDGASMNPVGRLGASARISAQLPWVQGLSAGVSAGTGYSKSYMPGGTPPGGFQGGVVADAQFPSQPWQQSYGGELFLDYDTPKRAGIQGSVHVAVAQGDPSLGYTSVLHDGVSHYYLFWRQTSQLYLALGLTY